MSRRRFDTERKKYKQMFEAGLMQILQSDRTQNMIEKLKLQDYRFMIAKPRHFVTVIDLMLKQFMKSNPIQVVFDSSFKDMMIPSMTAKLEAGRCIIAIDKGITALYILFVIECYGRNDNEYTHYCQCM